LVHLNRIEEKYKGGKKRLEEIMIFPGCFIELKEIGKIQAVLKDKGIDATIFLENFCCGLPYLLQGNKKEALRCMNKNLTFFNKIKIKKIITPCPFCLKMFKDYYPLLLNQTVEIEFEHICSFFSYRELKPTWKLSKKVAYHSPCLLDQKTASNHQKIIEQLAEDLYIPLREQICCGYGIGMPYLNEKISKDICQSNLSKIIGKGIQVLITDCPSCTTNWIKGLKERKPDLAVVPFWDLISNRKKP
jgi:Fe-S oxidoreductase